MSARPSRFRAGFTLVELLVVIVILVVVAALSVGVARKAIRTANISKDVQNLRQAGQALTAYASETGVFPIGWNSTADESWVDLLVKAEVGEDSRITQDSKFWSPLQETKIPTDLRRAAVTHFAANPVILTRSTGGLEQRPAFEVRTSQLTRPAVQILICGAPAKSSHTNYQEAEPVMWDMEPLLGGFPPDGSAPSFDPEEAETVVRLPQNISADDFFGAVPDFKRYNGGKGHFLFADGHLESLAPQDLRQKHWAVNY